MTLPVLKTRQQTCIAAACIHMDFHLASPLLASPDSISHPDLSSFGLLAGATASSSYIDLHKPSCNFHFAGKKLLHEDSHALWLSSSSAPARSDPTRGISGSSFHEEMSQTHAPVMDDAPERVVWDVQDTGIKELEMIRKETERLESLLTARSLRGPPGSSLSERAILSPAHAVAHRRAQERRSICEGSSQEAVIRAHVQMSQKLRAENSHLSAKRYILDAWRRAQSSADLSEGCIFEVAQAVVESGYLDDSPQELSQVMEHAVLATRVERGNASNSERGTSPFLDPHDRKDSMPAACSKFAHAVMRSSSSTSQLSLPGSTATRSGIK